MGNRRGQPAVRNGLCRLRVWYFVLLLTGCATPVIKPADPRIVTESDLLSFIRDGATTREEALLQSEMPAAQMVPATPVHSGPCPGIIS